tara:strand:- start:91 stop:483 length:393 start_codon:yes stop_codon:yes gene_type:complete
MNIDSRVLTVLLFLIVQSATGIWWASNLSSEVERVAGVQGGQHTKQIEALETDAQMCQIEIHNLQKLIADQSEIEDAVKGLDVLAFKVEELRKEISGLREVDKDIMTQHEKIFEWMANSSPTQQKGNPYN